MKRPTNGRSSGSASSHSMKVGAYSGYDSHDELLKRNAMSSENL